MEIKRFDEFVSESQEIDLELDYDYDNLDEGLMDTIKAAFTKPSLKDPKTAKDFGAMVNVVASKFPPNVANSPILIATKLVNLLTMFLNKQGPFKDRSGAPVAKPLPLVNKKGEVKTGGAGNKPKVAPKVTPKTGGKMNDPIGNPNDKK
jgi:hypothetical protein